MNKLILLSRKQRIFFIYQRYFTDKNTAIQIDNPTLPVLDQQEKQSIIQHLASLEKKIIPNIKTTWSWKRINKLHKAVLVNAVYEFYILKIDKPIIIDQAVEFIKKFDADKKYPWINSILDQILP